VSTDEASCSARALMTWARILKSPVSGDFISKYSRALTFENSCQARVNGADTQRVAIGDFVYEDPLAEAEYWLDTIRVRRGLFALEDIRHGHTLLSVPWSMCITTEHIRNSKHPLAALAATISQKSSV